MPRTATQSGKFVALISFRLNPIKINHHNKAILEI